ncbi:sugar MFS transporter [Shewanella sp. UCD-KL12]|uniref:sugar MFS transporter n=1 Tax=Shewanella sp. UCD-KL12 TaxID=1917163 RepID=UPI0009707515|nr:sugar MFS transporter [Shewanella sp. UCD-KL12]
MAAIPTTPPQERDLTSQGSDGKVQGYRFSLACLTSLFFIWGLLTSLNDILIPYLKGMFDLSYTQAMLIQFCFFGAYFIVSVPAGALVSKIGYQKGIVFGLMVAGVGALSFYPVATTGSYFAFLTALFVLAAGITLLQVSANPFVSVLGEAKTASSRLTMTQAFNSLGATLAPIFGGWLILSSVTEATYGSSQNQATAVQTPYLILASALFVMALIFAFLKLPKVETKPEEYKAEGKSLGNLQSTPVSQGSAWQYRHLVLGALAIFVYVGAEVGIGSLLINFAAMESIAGLEEVKAAKYVTYYWGGAMVGRFVGALVMQKVSAGKVLGFNSILAVALVLVATFSSGMIALWAIILVGLCNSIMFPTIFTLALRGLKQHTSQGSGVLCLAIVGGAILPVAQGFIADVAGIQLSFLLPMLCFVYIAYYGLVGCQLNSRIASGVMPGGNNEQA